jgi:hypothetical protein
MATKYKRLKKIGKPAEAPVVGIAITVTPHFNTHAGILYPDENNHIRMLHLEFHWSLRCPLFDYSSYLCADPELENEDAEAVAAHCRLIAKQQPQIWFAIHHNPKASFGRVGEKIVLLKEGKGLNCSTFVIAVFKHAGPELIDFNSWGKRPSDIAWQKQLLQWLKPKCPEIHWRRVAKDIGCARVRPEEIAGACLEEELPAGFLKCIENGKYVLEQISKHVGRQSKW